MITTVAVECVGMAGAAWVLRLNLWRAVVWCTLVNILAHTLFWRMLPWLAVWTSSWPHAGLWLAEGVVVIVEGALYWRLLRINLPVALLLALLLNLMSWWLGSLMLSTLGVW